MQADRESPRMSEFMVTYPTVGEATVVVEAETEAEAIEKGWLVVGDPDATEHTWEAMEHVVRGNVFYGPSNNIQVERA